MTASNDRTARVWDAESGEEIALLKSHGAAVRTAAFSVDGKRVVAATGDPFAIVWDVESGKKITQMEGHELLEDVLTAAFSGDGKWVVTASTDKTARSLGCADRQANIRATARRPRAYRYLQPR